MFQKQFVELDATVIGMLGAVRKHLGMSVGFISEFGPNQRYIRFVDAAGVADGIKVGDRIPLEQGYCNLILEGKLPELMPDTSRVAEAMSIDFTRNLPIGSHIGVPLWLPDGRLYGTFCCYRDTPNPALDERDLATMRAFADTIAGYLKRTWENDAAHELERVAVMEALSQKEPRVELQPIIDLRSAETLGFECLARFGGQPSRPPNQWFEAAETLGLGIELELSALRNGLAVFRQLPERCFLSLNCSPAFIGSGLLTKELEGLPLGRILIEVTEHEVVRDFKALKTALAPMRVDGLKTAMDDAGAGFSSLQHLVDLTPDIIKLDMSFAQTVGRDPAARAMVAAMVAFAEKIGSMVVAEGVEEVESAHIFLELGVHAAQGFYFSRPLHLNAAIHSEMRKRTRDW